jgi:hypothetical protein
MSGALSVAPVENPLPLTVTKTSVPIATNLNQTSLVLLEPQQDATEKTPAVDVALVYVVPLEQ